MSTGRKITSPLRVALAIGCLCGLIGLWPASAARAAGTIPVSASTTYTFLPSQAKLAVHIDLAIHSPLGFFVDQYTLFVEGNATSLKATSSSGSVKATLEKVVSDVRPVTLTFPRVLYGQTRKITLTYDVPGGKPRSSTYVRAGRAYALFCGFPGGDPYTSSVHLVLPESFAIDTLGTTVKLERVTKNGTLTLTANPQVEPYAVCIEAIDEAALAHDKVTTRDGYTVDVEGWPDDPTWMKDMARYVEAGVPVLEQLIGLPFPKTGSVIVREVESETLGGYGGMYDPATQVARVSERSDDARLVLHELSHVWFNQALLGDLWFDEGYADHFGFETAGKIGVGSGSCAPPPKYPGKGAPDLDNWKFLSSSRATAQEVQVVVWQYEASCWIMTLLGDAVGDDRMRDIIVALADHEIPYTGSGPAETLPAKSDWHRWLDLADERGIVAAGAKLDLGGLLAAYGIGDKADLDRRASLRTEYHALAAETGWAMPLAIRRPMADWNWDEADAGMKVAAQIEEEHKKTAALLPELGGDAALEKRFESAVGSGDLNGALDFAMSEERVAPEIVEARRVAALPRDTMQQVGLLGADPAAEAGEAAAALVGGDPGYAGQLADDVQAKIQGAETAGMIRAVGVGVGAVVLVFGSAFVLVWGRRRPEPESVGPSGATVAPSVVAEPALPAQLSVDAPAPTPPSSAGSTAPTASAARADVTPPQTQAGSAPRPTTAARFDPFAPRPCPNCGELNLPLAQVCPSCGTVLARRR